MAIDPESPLDKLWQEYGRVFHDFDDLTLARWLAQTLGQLKGRAWRLSHPLLGAYRLAAQIAHDRLTPKRLVAARHCCRCSPAMFWNRVWSASIVRLPRCRWKKSPPNSNPPSNPGRKNMRLFTPSRTGKTVSAKASATTTAPTKTPPGKPSVCWHKQGRKSPRSFWTFIPQSSGRTRMNVWKSGRRTSRYEVEPGLGRTSNIERVGRDSVES